MYVNRLVITTDPFQYHSAIGGKNLIVVEIVVLGEDFQIGGCRIGIKPVSGSFNLLGSGNVGEGQFLDGRYRDRVGEIQSVFDKKIVVLEIELAIVGNFEGLGATTVETNVHDGGLRSAKRHDKRPKREDE